MNCIDTPEMPQAPWGERSRDHLRRIAGRTVTLQRLVTDRYGRTIGLGDARARNQDVLGRVYEYFLGEFAAAEGQKGGQFYTPGSIVKTLVSMLEPYQGGVYDPCCGSGGMFVQAEKLQRLRLVRRPTARRPALAIPRAQTLVDGCSHGECATTRLCYFSVISASLWLK